MLIALPLTLINWNEVESNECLAPAYGKTYEGPASTHERDLRKVLLPHMGGDLQYNM